MQCEGVGEDCVTKIGKLVSDDEMAMAATKYPLNTPHTKDRRGDGHDCPILEELRWS